MISFSSNQIPELEKYDFQARREILFIANSMLTTPEKLYINLIKLIILVPVFLYIARLDVVVSFILAFLVLIVFLSLSPVILLQFSKKHIKAAIAKYEKRQSLASDE